MGRPDDSRRARLRPCKPSSRGRPGFDLEEVMFGRQLLLAKAESSSRKPQAPAKS